MTSAPIKRTFCEVLPTKEDIEEQGSERMSYSVLCDSSGFDPGTFLLRRPIKIFQSLFVDLAGVCKRYVAFHLLYFPTALPLQILFDGFSSVTVLFVFYASFIQFARLVLGIISRHLPSCQCSDVLVAKEREASYMHSALSRTC